MLQQKYQQTLVEFVTRHPFNTFVTLTFNDSHSFDYMRQKLKTFHARLDRHVLGYNWAKKSAAERTFFIAFAEKVNSNAHFHLMMKASDTRLGKIHEVAADTWKYLVPAGDCQIKSFCDADRMRIASYVTKEQRYSENNSNFIISTEFSSR